MTPIQIDMGACYLCGFDDDWHTDGRGNTLCGCQACPDCGLLDAYGFHEAGCPALEEAEEIEEAEDDADGSDFPPPMTPAQRKAQAREIAADMLALEHRYNPEQEAR